MSAVSKVGVGQLPLPPLATAEPTPRPVRQVGQGDLSLEPAEGPETSQRALRDRAPGQIGEDHLHGVLPR